MKHFINHVTEEGGKRSRERKKERERIIPSHNTSKRTNEDTFKKEQVQLKKTDPIHI